MSWGEPSAQPPFEQNPYGQQPFPQQPQQPPMPQQPSVPPQPQQPAPGWGSQPGAGYTQPLPDPSAYGQQSFPGAYQQPQGYGSEYPQYPPNGPKRGNGGLIAIVVGALVVVGGGVTAAIMLTGKHGGGTPVAGGSSAANVVTSTGAVNSPTAAASTGGSANSSNPLSVPTSVQGLTLLNNSASKNSINAMQTSLAKDATLYPDPVIAAYNDSTGNNVTTLFEAQAINQLSAAVQSQFSSTDPSDFVSQLMTGAGISDAQNQTTTATDGALSCGDKTDNSVDILFCFWDDGVSFGGLEYYDSTPAGTAASTADAVRAASEGTSN